MSKFQIGLIIIGLISIGLVLLYNWWVNTNAEKRVRRSFQDSDRDPLFAEKDDKSVKSNKGDELFGKAPQDDEAAFDYSTDNGSGAGLHPVTSEQADQGIIPGLSEPEKYDMPTFSPRDDAEDLDTVPVQKPVEQPLDKPVEAPEQKPAAKTSKASAAGGVFASGIAAVGDKFKSKKASPAVESNTSSMSQPALEPYVDETKDSVKHEPDFMTEAVIDLQFHAPLQGRQIQEEILKYPVAVDKTIRYFMVTSDGSSHASVRPDEEYIALQMAVLLANRNGPLNQEHWSKAMMIADELASQFDASIDAPELRTIEPKARALDDKCARLDAQVSISLVTNKPYPLQSIVDLARRRSYVDYRQTLAWAHHQGSVCFVLLFDGLPLSEFESNEVERIIFLIDVPNSPADKHAFGKMVAAARDMAKSLDAEIVDDQGHPLQGSATLDEVDEQLYKLYQSLERAGLPAGSDRNLRIFS